MATDVAQMSTSRLRRGLQAARSQLVRIRDAAEEGAKRLIIAGGAAAGAYGTGYLHGWAELNNKDITIGDSETAWTLPIGAVATLGGAFGTRFLGESLSNVAFGGGIGMLSGELALMGQKKGATPKTGA